MLVEINYQGKDANGTIVNLTKMVREDDITSVYPGPTDSTKTVVEIRLGTVGSIPTVLNETYASFVSRYSNATSGTRVIAAPTTQSQQAQSTQAAS